MNNLDLKIEMNGIIGTISSYTKNPYVTGYATSLKKAVLEDDPEMARLSIKKLLEWYDGNIQSILKNEYIGNKQDHLRTKMLLEKANADFH